MLVMQGTAACHKRKKKLTKLHCPVAENLLTITDTEDSNLECEIMPSCKKENQVKHCNVHNGYNVKSEIHL